MTRKIINITGNARNIEGKAVLEVEKIGTYFIADMKQWDKEWENRRIKVIGDLEVIEKNKSMYIKHPVVQRL